MERNSAALEDRRLIQEQGLAFMRALKIHEKGNGPSKKYYIRPTINGRTMYVTFPSREDAQVFLSIIPRVSTNPNLKTFFDYFFEAINQIESHNTKRTYFGRVKNLKPILEMPIAGISKKDLQKIFRSTNPSAWSALHGVLYKVSLLAEDEKFESFRRALKDEFQHKSNTKQVKSPEGIIEALQSITMSIQVEERARLAFLIMCYTGLRVGELGCLSPDEIGDVLVVKKTVVNTFTYSQGHKYRTSHHVQEKTKGKDQRVVPLTKDVQELFYAYFALFTSRQFKKGNYVIHGRDIARYLPEIAKAAGIREKLSPHTARHIFGTIFGSKCENIGDAMKLQNMLGHKSFKTTQRYISIANATAEDIMSKMPSLKR